MPVKILLADDQVGLQDALRVWLEVAGEYRLVGKVSDARQLLDAAQKTQPDILLLDWELQGLNGSTHRGLLESLRARFPHLRIVALSSRLGTERQVLSAGVDALVSKTEPPELLLETLQRLNNP